VAEEEIRSDASASEAETAAALHQLTQMGTMMGTPDYISPEQAQDSHTADIRADIYSLGCTFYTLLTGRAPFSDGSVLDKIRAHTEQTPQRLAAFRDDIPAEVEAILLRMMAKDPEDRPQTPQDVVDALTKLIDARIDDRLRRHGIGEPPIPPKPRTVGDSDDRFNNIAKLVGLTLLVVAIVAGVIAGTWQAIYLATDTGRLEITNAGLEVHGARIVLLKDGQEYASFAVEPGTHRQTIRAGEYEVALRGAPPGVELDVRSTKKGQTHDFGAPTHPQDKVYTVYRGGGMSIEVARRPGIATPLEGDIVSESIADWTLLFNGRDLTGWKMQPDKPGNWRVENGVLIGGKLDGGSEEENSFLVTEKSDFTNFHLKLEAKLNPGAADAGVLFDFADGSWAEANIAFNPSQRDQYVGSIMVAGTKLNGVTWQAAPRDLASPDQWFTLEVIAVDRQITTKVNGKVAVVHTQRKQTTGPIRLQDHGPFTVVEFRKIEIVELDEDGKPLPQPTSPEAAPLTIGMNDGKSVLLPDALAVYTFEEDTFFRKDGRLRVRDVSGNGHDASVEDDQPAYSPDGKAGGALLCNRRVLKLPLAKLRLPTALLAGRDEYTMALWVRDSGKATLSSGKSARTLFQEGFPRGADAAYPFSVNLVDQRMRIFSLRELVEQDLPGGDVPINGEVFTDEDTIPKDKWYFLALTLVRNGDAHMLRVTIDDQTTEHPFAPVPDLEYGFSLLGGIDGMIDEVAFFGRAFTGQEIETLRQHGLWKSPVPESSAPPLTIGMNDEFGMLFEGRLVAPAELSRRLDEALQENPDREVVIDLPKRPWTVAGHVDQLEQIARITGAKWITRPVWSQIRIVFGVDKSGEQTLDIEGPGYSATGLLEDQLPNVREVIAKNSNLPVQIEVVEPFRFSDPKNAIGLAKVRDATKAAGDKVRVVRTRAKDDRKTVPLPPIRIGMNDKGVPTFNGRLVPPHEQADLLVEALQENPDREVVIDLPQRPWTVVPHVDQLEQVARIAGAKRIARPAWAAKQKFSINLIGTLPGDGATIEDLLYLPDGKRLVSGGKSNQLVIWDVTSRQRLKTLRWDQGIRCFLVLPDGRIVTGGEQGTIRIWNLDEPEKSIDLTGHTKVAMTLTTSPDAKLLFSGSPEDVRLWNLETGKEIEQDSTGCRGAAFLKSGQQIVHLSKNKVLLRDSTTFKILGTLAEVGQHRNLLRLAVSDDEKYLAYGDIGVYCVDLTTGKDVGQFPVKDQLMQRKIAFIPGTHYLVSGDDTPLLRLIDVDAGKELDSIVPNSHSSYSLVISPDGRQLASAGGTWKTTEGQYRDVPDKSIYLWQLPESVWPTTPQPDKINLLRELPGSKEWITAVAYPENDRAVTAALDGVVRVWKNGGAELDSHQLPFGGLADISPDGKSILIASPHDEQRQSTVALWDIEPWQERWRITFPVAIADGELGKLVPKHVIRARFAPQGRVVVQSNAKSGVAIVDAESGEIQSRFPDENSAMGAAAVSPDGQRLFVRLAMRPSSGTFGRVYRIADGAELAQIDCKDVVLDAVWSRDGAHIILSEATLNEGRIAVFDASTGKLVRRWVAEPNGIESLALGRGNLLVTGGMKRIAVWEWSTEKLLAAVDSPQQDGSSRMAIAVSPDGKRLISGGARWLDGEDRLPRLWQLPESAWPK
jgi:WD40 repeat protein